MPDPCSDFIGVYWTRFAAGYTVSQSLWWAGWTVSWAIYDNAVTFGYPEITWMPP